MPVQRAGFEPGTHIPPSQRLTAAPYRTVEHFAFVSHPFYFRDFQQFLKNREIITAQKSNITNDREQIKSKSRK